MPGKVKSLLTKILLKRTPEALPSDTVKNIDQMTAQDVQMVKDFGATMSDLGRMVSIQTHVNFDRFNFYREVERAILHPLVGAAVELYADVSSTFSQLQGATVWVTSENRKYENELNAMLDRIGIEERIFDWAWNTSCYGDLFLRANGEPGLGITSVSDADHPINISRLDYNGRLIGFFRTPIGLSYSERKLMPPWQYVHCRILGVKKKRPLHYDPNYTEFATVHVMAPDIRRVTSRYGTSVLNNALPTYKRMRLAEDSLLMARLSKGVLRYVYKIKVDGCLVGSTEIRLLDGSTVTIKELADNKDNYIGKSVWTVDESTQKLVPNKIIDAMATRRNAELVRVHLDNGEYVDCTPDHLFLLRNGSYKEAQELAPDDSLMPHYEEILGSSWFAGYRRVYDTFSSAYQQEHALVVERQDTFDKDKNEIVHHIDYNRLNNDPSNLSVMTRGQHSSLHIKHGRDGQHRWLGKKQSKTHVKRRFASRDGYRHTEDTKKKISDTKCSRVYDYTRGPHSEDTKKKISSTKKKMFAEGTHGVRSKDSYTRRPIVIEERECLCGCGIVFQCDERSPKRFCHGHMPKETRSKVITTINKARLALRNHRVVRVERLAHREDTYDLCIENIHNFPLAAGVFVHNSNFEGVSEIIDEYKTLLKRARAVNTDPNNPNFEDKFMAMNINEDVIIPVWGDVNDLAIEELGGKCLRHTVGIELMNGSTKTIGEMFDNKDLYIGQHVYACSKSGQIVPRKICGISKTRLNATFVRVTLDNGKQFDVTPDHPCMLRDGSFLHAELLQPGQPLMPLYRRVSDDKFSPGYEQVYNPAIGKYVFTHRLVGKEVPALAEERNQKLAEIEQDGLSTHPVIHHKDRNKLNNEPSNLQWCEEIEHLKEHAGDITALTNYVKSDRGRSELRQRRLGKTYDDLYSPEVARQTRIKIGKFTTRKNNKRWGKLTQEEKNEWMQENIISKRGDIQHQPGCTCMFCRTKSGEVKSFNQVSTRTCKHCGQEFVDVKASVFLNHCRWCKQQQAVYANHTVASVERLDVIEDAYDLAIEDAYDQNGGPEHCFAISAGVFVHNTDIRWIADIEELRNQLASALRVPLQLLGGYPGEMPGGLGQSALARYDIRFARQARRVQRSMIDSITRLCQIHLSYMGMDPNVELFRVQMPETSTAEEEELRDALDKGTDVVTKIVSMVVDTLGEESINRVELLDYLNQKILKLDDFDVRSFLNANPENENEAKKIQDSIKEDAKDRKARKRVYEKNLNSDFLAHLPQKAKVKANTVLEAKTMADGDSSGTLNEDWSIRYSGVKVMAGKAAVKKLKKKEKREMSK